jgi:hypothetical protein
MVEAVGSPNSIAPRPSALSTMSDSTEKVVVLVVTSVVEDVEETDSGRVVEVVVDEGVIALSGVPPSSTAPQAATNVKHDTKTIAARGTSFSGFQLNEYGRPTRRTRGEGPIRPANTR